MWIVGCGLRWLRRRREVEVCEWVVVDGKDRRFRIPCRRRSAIVRR